MSSTIDERVVQMQFDNAQFESGVRQTLQSLEKLNNSIEENTKKGGGASLNWLEKSLSAADSKIISIQRNVQNLKNTFSVAGVVGQRVVNNITDSLYKMAINCGKTLTGINSMTSGFDKFGQKTKAVSTLMVATGASLDEVTKTVDDLAWFSDQTSYNFTDMVDNMAKLTASGEKNLSQLAVSVKGFALAGARAGVGAEKVSHGMYQLSQAASRGYIMLQDWQQAFGLTNIASATLKKQLIEAGGASAIAAGANRDFNGSLQKGWLTMDVYNKVMSQYTAGINQANWDTEEYTFKNNEATNSTTEFSKAAFQAAQECRTWSDVVDAVKDAISTGWSNSYELIFGNVNEVRKLWTGICNYAIDISDRFTSARNNLLAEWRNAGGRDELLKSFVNILNGVHRLIQPIREAFQEVFGGINGERLAGATASLQSFTKSIQLSKEQMIEVKKVFLSIFNTIKTVFNALSPYKKQILIFFTVLTVLKSIQGLMLGGLGFGSFAAILKIIVGLGILGHFTKLNKVVGVTISILQKFGSTISNVASRIGGSKILQGLITGLKLVGATIAWLVIQAVNGIATIVNKIRSSNVLDSLLKKLSSFKEFAVGVINKLAERITGVKDFKLDSFDNFLLLIKGIATGIGTVAGSGIKNLSKLFSGLTTPFSKLIELLKGGEKTFDSVNGTVDKSRPFIQGMSGDLSKMSTNILGVNAATGAFVEQLSTFSKSGKGIFKNFATFLSKINWQNVFAVGAIVLYLLEIRSLSKGVSSLANVFTESSQTITKSVKGCLTSISGFFKSLTAENKTKRFRDIAIGIGLIAGSLALLSMVATYNSDGLDHALVVLGAIAVGLVGLTYAISNISNSINPAGVVAIGIALAEFGAILLEVSVILGIITVITTHFINSSSSLGEAIGKMFTPVAVLITMFVGLGMALAAVAAFSPMLSTAAMTLLKLGGGLAAFGAGLTVFNISIITTIVLIKVILAQLALFGAEIVAAAVAWTKLSTGMKAASLVGLIVGIAGAIALFYAVVKIGKKVVDDLAGMTLKMAMSIFVLAGAVAVLSKAMAILGKYGGDPIRDTKILAAAIGGLYAIVLIASQSTVLKAANNISTLSKALLRFAIALLVAAGTTALFGNMDFFVLMKGFIGIATTLLAFGAVLKVLDKVNVGKIAAGILSLVVAMYLLTPIFALFGVAWKPIIIGILLVAAAMISLAGAVKLMDKAQPKSVISIVTTMILAVLAIGHVCQELSKIPVDNLAAATAAIVFSFIALGSSVALLSGMSKFVEKINIWPILAITLSLAGGLTILTLAFSQLSGMPIESIIGLLLTFTACIAGLAIVFKFVGVEVNAAIPAMVVIIGVLIACAAVALAFAAAIYIVTSAISAFLPSVEQFIGFLVSMGQYSDVLGSLAGPLVQVGAALIVVSAALYLLGPASTIAGIGLTVFGGGLTIAAKAVLIASAAITQLAVAFESIKSLASEAISWGADLTSNMAFGLLSGVRDVAGAALSIAKTIWAYLHQSTAEIGPLKDTNIWGFDLDTNIATSMLKGIPLVGQAAEAVGLKTKDGFISATKGAGDEAASGILGEFGSYLGQFFGLGQSAGLSLKRGIASIAGRYLSPKSERIARESADTSEYIDLKNYGKPKKAVDVDDSDIFSYEDLLGSLKDANSGLADSFDDVAGSAGKAAKKTGGAGGASKKATESQKELAKYLKYSNEVLNTFGTSYGGVLALVDDVSPMIAAQSAFSELCAEIYADAEEASDSVKKSTDETAKNAKDKAAEIRKAFVEAFVKVKKQVSDGIDFFSKFDMKLGEALTPDQILNNADSQMKGYKNFYERVMNLGLKGFNKDVIQSIIDEGVAAYPKVSGMLKMTADQVDKLNEKFANKKAFASQAAAMAMTARMNVILISHLKTRLKAETAMNEEILKEAKAYKDLEASGTASMSDLQDQLKKVSDACVKHGTTLEAYTQKVEKSQYKVNEEIMKAAEAYKKLESSGSATSEELMASYKNLTQVCEEHGTTIEEVTRKVRESGTVSNQVISDAIDKMEKAYSVMSRFQDYAETIGEGVKSALESAFDPFGEWDTKYDLTGAKLVERVNKSLAGMKKYAAQMTNIAVNGGQDIITYFSDKFKPDIINAMSQLDAPGITSLSEKLLEMKNLAETAGANASAQWMSRGKLDGMTYQQAFNEYTSQANFLNTAVQNMGKQFSATIQPIMTTSAMESVNTYVTAMGTGFEENAPAVQKTGLNNAMLLTESMAAGVNEQSGVVMQAGSNLSQAVNNAVRSVLTPDNGHAIGANWGSGLINGIRSQIAEAQAAAVELANAVASATAGALEVHSPSRLAYRIGKFWDEGLAKGQFAGLGMIKNASVSVADTVVNTMQRALSTARDILSDDISTQPVITPVIDLSDAQNGMRRLGSMFNYNGFRVNANLGHITTNADKLSALQSAMTQGNNSGSNINFTQNNYSPTALSRLDIYRQTRNQLAILKGMVGVT
ncbi:hypothetical protein [Lachnoclostridium sp. Marseille-P6806]|uniref:hypothetical protein n=1 Tax=Lachnoclostridium sp. Marseille-P6806 TaxID=2364793 RepID=UPI0010323512|nr:hypothetical protein [Lachnoclostridium sp. Marseille-P6806]